MEGDHVRDLDPFKRRRPQRSAQEGGERRRRRQTAAVSVRASLEDGRHC